MRVWVLGQEAETVVEVDAGDMCAHCEYAHWEAPIEAREEDSMLVAAEDGTIRLVERIMSGHCEYVCGRITLGQAVEHVLDKLDEAERQAEAREVESERVAREIQALFPAFPLVSHASPEDPNGPPFVCAPIVLGKHAVLSRVTDCPMPPSPSVLGTRACAAWFMQALSRERLMRIFEQAEGVLGLCK